MVFSKESRDYLEAMGVSPETYEQSLVKEFGNSACLFQKVIAFFKGFPGEAMSTNSFNCFYASTGYPIAGSIHEKSYDLFNYLRLFNSGGKLNLYKGRQAEWDGPKVRLDKSDVPSSDIHLISGVDLIYRGMSENEFNSRTFGQSWTTDILTAKRFALETYSDKPAGIIATAKINIANVIYYSKDDQEHEIIVADGSIVSANIFNA